VPAIVELVGALTATLLGSGCAGSDMASFDQPGFGIGFDYPGGLEYQFAG